MALFTLSDITYKEQEARTVRPLTTSEYSRNLLRYPIDIGSVDKGHYMLIHINVQNKTEYSANYANDPRSTIHKNREALSAQTGYTNLGGLTKEGIGILKSGATTVQDFVKENYDPKIANSINDFVAKGAKQLSNLTGGTSDDIYKIFNVSLNTIKEELGSLDNSTFLRTTKRTTDSIALYMPNTLNFNHSQSYSDLSLAGENATTFGAIAKTIIDGGFDANVTGKNITPFILQQLTKIGGSLTGSPNSATAIFAGTGLSQNPQLELIYGRPDFRSFRFSFMFYPRSEDEALEVQNLISRLKFHQAPEIKNGTAGYFLVPPSEFDIEFYYNGQINKNIPAISTCVLQSIDLDYAPNGFHAFETPGYNSPELGGTGMPVAIRMDLSFKETEIMTKFNYQEEAGSPLKRTQAEIKASANLGNFPG